MATTTEGFLAVDIDGVLRLMNEAAESIFRVRRVDVIDKPFSVLGDDTLITQVSEAIERWPFEGSLTVGLSPDDRMITCTLVCFEEPERKGLAITVRDDSELIHQQKRAETILENTGDGLVVFSPDGSVTYLNPVAVEMLDVDVSEIVGTKATIGELLGMDAPDTDKAVRCWEHEECTRTECPVHGSDDLRCWLRSGTLNVEGEPRSFSEKRAECEHCVVYLHNERVLTECGIDGTRELSLDGPESRVIRIQANPVIDKNGEYAGCVTSLRDVTAEREIMQMKNEFVSTVSHELRTPLTSIKGYVDLILDGDAGEINDIQKEFLTIVKSNSDRLVALINDMLDISRIESGRVVLNIEPLSIQDLIADIVGTFMTIIDQSDIDLSLEIEKDLEAAAGDRNRAGQVLTNLVSNAIKYSPNGGKVTIRAWSTENEIMVSVTDTGIGISLKDQEQLFNKFYRVDSSYTQEIGGTGLGLSICKSIIELHGGRIWIDSILDEGSSFGFSLPTASARLVRTPAVEGPDQVVGKILVIDKDAEIASLIETYLKKRGYQVVKANSAKDAIRIAEREHPSAITLDVMLDDMDGFVLLQQFKDNPTTSGIPVIVLSVVCDEGRSCRMGAASYMEKPIDQGRLINIIDGLVGSVEAPLILVVDDDKDVVDSIGRGLKSRGFAVAGAYNGTEAFASLADQRPDLILTDLRMPSVDGYQLIEAVKKDPETKDIPIVVMTGQPLDKDRVHILELASGQLAKPFSLQHVADEIVALIGGGKVG